MNLSSWNDLLRTYFFSQRETLTFLAIDKETLLDLAQKSDKIRSEAVLCRGENASEKEIRDYAWGNFLNSFLHRRRPTFSLKEHLLAQFRNLIIESKNEPRYLPYIALFIIPLNNDPELQANTFYKKVSDFLKGNGLISPNDTFTMKDFESIRTSLDSMWLGLTEWAAREGYTFNVKQPDGPGRYVKPFLSQLLFTATQRNNLKVLFYRSGLTRFSEVEDEQIKQIYLRHYSVLGISPKRWKMLKDGYLDSLVNIFSYELSAWNGESILKQNTGTGYRTSSEGSNYSLLLSLTFNGDTPVFGLCASINDSEIGEQYNFLATDGSEVSFLIDGNNISKNAIWSNDVRSCIVNGKQVVLTQSNDGKTRLIYNPSDIILLTNSFGKIRETQALEPGYRYFVLVDNQKIDFYQSWLDSNEAKKFNRDFELSTRYTLFQIRSAKSELTTSKLRKLHFENKREVKLINTITLPRDVDGSKVLYQGFPAYFQITGIDPTLNNVSAVFDSDGIVESIQLTFNAEDNTWELPVIKNFFQKQKSFRLFCNNEQLSYVRYRVGDFASLKESEYEELTFNGFGEYASDGNYAGLKLPHVNNIPWGQLQSSMKKGNPIGSTKRNYKAEDYILFYLSSTPRVEKKDLAELLNALSRNGKLTEESLDKWTLNGVIDNYSRLGYINYAYIAGKHIIAVNRPTLILRPPKSKRIKNYGLRIIAQEEQFWTAILTGARTPKSVESLQHQAQSFSYKGEKVVLDIETNQTPLMPQNILLKSYSLDAIGAFAEKFGYVYQKCIYGDSLLSSLASVAEYEEYITAEETDDCFDDISNRQRIDYQKLAETGRYVKTTDFNRDGAVVTYFPNKYNERTIYWLNGKQYVTDRHWGHLLGMKQCHAKVFHFDTDSNQLRHPVMLQLPRLYARAFALMAGAVPKEENYERIYDVYVNPYVDSNPERTILSKLSQNT